MVLIQKSNPVYLCIAADRPDYGDIDIEDETIAGCMGYIIKIDVNNGTINLIDPCKNFKGLGKTSVYWLGSDTDFSTIFDDHNGGARFGKQNNPNAKVVYNIP